jgi:hypothetical protein
MSTQKQAPFTVTPPRRDEAQDWRGGYVTLALVQNFISTSNRDTSPDRDVSYLEFVFSSYVQYHSDGPQKI